MKSRKFIVVVAAACMLACGFSLANILARPSAVPTRDFAFTYTTRIPNLPAGARVLRVWIPLPQSDAFQTVRDLKIESPVPYSRHRDAEYGNEYAFLEIPAERVTESVEVRMGFNAVRREHRVLLGTTATAAPSGTTPTELARFLQPDHNVPLQGAIADLSTEQTRGITEPLAKAKAIYDYVVSTMRYDKSGTGWGRGDAVWACTSKRGNCTDFHSVLIGMMRATGIPARFEIGFSLPPDQHGGDIPGYHCWAEFYLQAYGWIPVDASEAWKHPEKRSYFFGAHDDDRLQFTTGRDIRLDPPQHGDPLNYFIYPYGEVDGKPLALQSKFSFRDQPAD